MFLTDLFHTILAVPCHRSEDCANQCQALLSLSNISSLFLIDNLPDYIQFINRSLPHVSDLSKTLSQLISRIFVVYTEMRNLSHAFDAILSQHAVPQLASLYINSSIEACLQQQVLQILPLQLHDILQKLLPYVLGVELHN